MDKQKQFIKENANGYAVENGKIIYFSNMLDGYRHEFKDLEEVVEEMNGIMKKFDSYMSQIEYWKHKAEEKIPEGAVVISKEQNENWLSFLEQNIEKARKEAVEKFAERVKMAFYYEFDELIPSIMADKIDEIAKEFTEEENGKSNKP